MKIYRKNEVLYIDGELNLTLMKSDEIEEGFITAMGIKLSEEFTKEKANITGFWHWIVPTDFMGKLRLLKVVLIYIFGK